MAWAIVAAIAAVLILFLVVSVFLPGTWTASRSTLLSVEAQEVFLVVGDLREWDGWMDWTDASGVVESGAAGVGAERAWDDPGLGQGRLRITGLERNRSVEYEVEIEGGSLRVRGHVDLEPADAGRTRLTWTETGDFGWNPLLRYMALGMPNMQGREMEKALDRLANTLESRAGSAP